MELSCGCGQCALVCSRVLQITEKDDTQLVWDVLVYPAIHVVVQTAPAIRGRPSGEEMGLPWVSSESPSAWWQLCGAWDLTRSFDIQILVPT